MLDRNKFSHTVISIIGVLILALLFFKYVFWGILPIALGWLVSLFIFPLGERLSKRLHISRRILSGVLVILFFLLLFLLAAIAIKRLFSELSLFAQRLQNNPEIIENALTNIQNSFSDFKLFSGFEKIISALGEYAYIADEFINNILDSTLSALGVFLTDAAKNLVLGIPAAFLFAITFIMSAFYFSVDRDKIYGFFAAVIPEGAKAVMKKFTQGGAVAAAGYIKSSLILMVITFFEMLIALTLLGVEYSLILSIIIAIVDILPLLGVGAVLVPWSIYSFIVSDIRRGVWLLVIFAVATVARNILEPKILGKKIGAHPFVIIASAYLGYILLGGGGLLIGPIIAAVAMTMRGMEGGSSLKP